MRGAAIAHAEDERAVGRKLRNTSRVARTSLHDVSVERRREVGPSAKGALACAEQWASKIDFHAGLNVEYIGLSYFVSCESAVELFLELPIG